MNKLIALLIVLGLPVVSFAGTPSNSNNSDNSTSHTENNSAAAASAAGGNAKQKQGQKQTQNQTAVSAVSTTDNSISEATDGRQLRKAAERHAETAPNATAYSNGAPLPCGDSVGVSGQVGVGGVGLGTITETCRAFRLNVQQELYPNSFATKLATFTHYVAFPFRLVLTIGTAGLLG